MKPPVGVCCESYGAKSSASIQQEAAGERQGKVKARQGKAHTDAGPPVGGEAVALGTPAAAGAQLVDAAASAAPVVHSTFVHVCQGAAKAMP